MQNSIKYDVQYTKEKLTGDNIKGREIKVPAKHPCNWITENRWKLEGTTITQKDADKINRVRTQYDLRKFNMIFTSNQERWRKAKLCWVNIFLLFFSHSDESKFKYMYGT